MFVNKPFKIFIKMIIIKYDEKITEKLKEIYVCQPIPNKSINII